MSALWADYFRLLDTLRESAVWRWDEDGQLLDDGQRKPPRFVAVIEDAASWQRLEALVQELAVVQERTKWPIQLFNESWGWGKVSVTSAVSSRRVPPGEWLSLGVSDAASTQAAEEVVARLVAEGHKARVRQVKAQDGESGGIQLEVLAAPGLSMRWGHGRAFTLRAWDTDGVMLHRKISVGAVVVRGVQQGIHLDQTPRKQRKDTARWVCRWDGKDYYQVGSVALL
ncbi:hypothetical protein [Deinococcus radiophilus]|uniref:Uncharacterized protein n=1 Tax=Deinococcus radiophilus TaxID=32062 RepID=A0A3S0I2F2_9DEIO|nr:hypothetical protein [Deinococcus radiophilus]RTR22116.1 hypothetical protein EJ104_12870 [Deinococcus radiophilus]UFA51932.1 hypothetical protein LMT64_13325 [Deinococcus radiophilus]